MEKHKQVLSYLFMGFSLVAFIVCTTMLLIFTGIMSIVSAKSGSAAPLVVTGGIGSIFMMIVLVTSLPGFLAGYGLWKDKPWGKVLSIIMGIIYLMQPPFGTALGIYALWVLLSDESMVVPNQTPA